MHFAVCTYILSKNLNKKYPNYSANVYCNIWPSIDEATVATMWNIYILAVSLRNNADFPRPGKPYFVTMIASE